MLGAKRLTLPVLAGPERSAPGSRAPYQRRRDGGGRGSPLFPILSRRSLSHPMLLPSGCLVWIFHRDTDDLEPKGLFANWHINGWDFVLPLTTGLFEGLLCVASNAAEDAGMVPSTHMIELDADGHRGEIAKIRNQAVKF